MKDNGEEKGEFFVSRRGRHVGMHELDMTDIDIDTDNVGEKKTKKREESVKVSAPKIPKAKRQRHVMSRRTKIIIVAVVVLIIAIPLAGLEFVAGQYRSGVAKANSDTKSLVNSTVLPAQKKGSVSADQLHQIADKVNDTLSHMCRGGLVDNIASLYPRAKAEYDKCKSTQTKYSSLVSGLYELEGEARYLEKLDACVKPISTPITDAYAVIDAQQETWQQSSDCMKKLSPPTQMAAAHAELAEHTLAAAVAWLKLSTAAGAQDAAGFSAAEKALASEYEAIRGTAGRFNGSLVTTQNNISASYKSLQ